MKTEVLTGITFLGILIVSLACKKEENTFDPQLAIDFLATSRPSVDYPIQVDFRNISDSADQFNWNFGNGIKSSQQSPRTDYYSSGSFEVQLMATKGAITQVKTKKIDVPFRRLSVAMIYLIPNDISFNKALFDAIKAVNPLVQNWYRQQLNEKTYTINSPVVDTIKSTHPATEYGSLSTDLLAGVEQEVYSKLGTRLNRNEQVVLIFYPVDSKVEGVGWATKKNGEERRTGLIAANSCNLIASSSITDQYKGLWAVAHELGHALGLSHNLSYNSLMFGPVDDSGYLPFDAPHPTFPSCYLTQTDKQALQTSPFLR